MYPDIQSLNFVRLEIRTVLNERLWQCRFCYSAILFNAYYGNHINQNSGFHCRIVRMILFSVNPVEDEVGRIKKAYYIRLIVYN